MYSVVSLHLLTLHTFKQIMSPLPCISSVPSLSTERRASILDSLFEPCAQLHTLSVAVLHDEIQPDYSCLILAIGDQLTSLLHSSSTSDSDWLNAILSAHPRLGDEKIDSELSRQEQTQLQQGDGAEESEGLADLNRKYEDTFPGLKYV